jgi:hypothetical protein
MCEIIRSGCRSASKDGGRRGYFYAIYASNGLSDSSKIIGSALFASSSVADSAVSVLLPGGGGSSEHYAG